MVAVDNTGRGCTTVTWWVGRAMTNDSTAMIPAAHGGEPEDGRQGDSGVLERPGTEGGDAVAELVGGDHEPGGGGGHGDQVGLGEADGERQQRRAAQAGQPERERRRRPCCPRGARR